MLPAAPVTATRTGDAGMRRGLLGRKSDRRAPYVRPAGPSHSRPGGALRPGGQRRRGPVGPVALGRRPAGRVLLERLEGRADAGLELRVPARPPVLGCDGDLDVRVDAVVLDRPAGAVEPEGVARL